MMLWVSAREGRSALAIGCCGEHHSVYITHTPRPIPLPLSLSLTPIIQSTMASTRPRSGTIPSMEASGQELKDNTVIVGEHTLQITPTHRTVEAHFNHPTVLGASGDLAKKKVRLPLVSFSYPALILLSPDLPSPLRSLSYGLPARGCKNRRVCAYKDGRC